MNLEQIKELKINLFVGSPFNQRKILLSIIDILIEIKEEIAMKEDKEILIGSISY